MPPPSIATQAPWTQSGQPGWVSGWKLPRLLTVADGWMPLAADLAADLTPAHVADHAHEHAPLLLDALGQEELVVLGDLADHDPARHDHCTAHRRTLVTTRRGRSPHPDDGVAVRRLFHALRSRAIEHCNGQFTVICACGGQVPTTGLLATRRFVLWAPSSSPNSPSSLGSRRRPMRRSALASNRSYRPLEDL